MAMYCPLFFCFLLSLPIAIIRQSTVSASLNLLGVSPQDADYYRSGSVISCKDGFGSFHVDRLNDDFCDCFDGTDEPGTSACPNGRFHCKNQNHSPLWIFSSRVNDGICDCCDGSDEYEREINCVLSCPKDNDDDDGAGKKAVKETVPIRLQSDKLKFGSWKPERRSLNNAVHKLRDLKILMVMEMGLVFLLLYQFYGWSRRRGSNLRKRLP